MKTTTLQTARIVDIYLSQQSDGSWASHYALHFDQFYHWSECLRLLNEAKFKHTVFLVSLQYRLAVAFTQHFAAEGLAGEPSEDTVADEQSETSEAEETFEVACVLPGGYPGMCETSSHPLITPNQHLQECEWSLGLCISVHVSVSCLLQCDLL